MFKKPLLATLLTSTMALAISGGVALAEDGTSNQAFYDKTRLIDTAMADDQAALTEAQAAAQTAQAALDAANADLQALNDQIAGLPADDPTLADLQAQASALQDTINNDFSPTLTDAQSDLASAQTSYDGERALVESDVNSMSSDQLFAFNRSLNNAAAEGLVVDLDSDDLQAAIDGNYDKHQINDLTKALEEESKFLSRAQMFEQKAAETGDDKFLEKADKMRDRAEDKKEHFMAKIEDDFDHNHDNNDLDDDASSSDDNSSQEAAKEQQEATREALKEQREAAKEAVKDSHEAAKEAAKEAREMAKEAAKEARDAAKETAKEAADS